MVFLDTIPDPSVEIVAKGIEIMMKFNPDVVIALGGGSAIDAAKAICDFNLKSYKKIKLIAIPTTSGTGSEVTSISVITDKNKNIKYPLISDELQADEAILAAELVCTVPDFINRGYRDGCINSRYRSICVDDGNRLYRCIS